MAGSVVVTGNIAVDQLGDVDGHGSDRLPTASRWTRSILAIHVWHSSPPLRHEAATVACSDYATDIEEGQHVM